MPHIDVGSMSRVIVALPRIAPRASTSTQASLLSTTNLRARLTLSQSRKASTLILPSKSQHPERLSLLSTSRVSVRHCSQRRKMYFGEGIGGSVDVTKGREVLPTNVKPVHYDLTLEPNFEKFTYEGTVKIEYVLTGKGAMAEMVYAGMFELTHIT